MNKYKLLGVVDDILEKELHQRGGKYIAFPVALPGEYCHGCGTRHVSFEYIKYELGYATCTHGREERWAFIIADGLKHAEQIPGFRRVKYD